MNYYFTFISLFLIIALPLSYYSTTSPEHVLEEGLVAYYSFNECDARDDSGNGSDGQLFGNVGCWCGVDDDGLMLDGNEDYIEFYGPVNDYFTTSDFTVSFYFKIDRFNIFKQSMLSKREDCLEEEYMLDIQLDQANRIIDADVRENEWKFYQDIDPQFEGAGWFHFALVREGRYAYTYINGQLQKKATRCSGVDISNEANLSFANTPCLQQGMLKRFKGVIDELRIYDRALTAGEMLSLYNLNPVEQAETDCVSFNDEKPVKDIFYTTESTYLCKR